MTSHGVERRQAGETKSNDSNNAATTTLSFLSDLIASGSRGVICVRVMSVSEGLRSRGGWQYRKLRVSDRSMEADFLIAESKFASWKFRPGDHIICSAKSNGVDNVGELSLFFGDFAGPFDAARLLYEYAEKSFEAKRSSSGRAMKSSETVYQISAREARSLQELIRLWVQEGKPQHYTKWCQMHQIVATNLFYMGLVRRTASMSGYYYPTREALEFFSGRRNFPKKKVFVRDSEGKHVLVAEDGEAESKSFAEYLEDYADRDSALREYREALASHGEKIKAILEQNQAQGT